MKYSFLSQFLFFVFVLTFSGVGQAQDADCARIRVLPSSQCINLKVTLDLSTCPNKPIVKQARVECQSDFLAEYIFETETHLFRTVMTKNANSTWSAGAPVAELLAHAVPAPKLPEKIPSGINYWAEFRMRAENNKDTNLANSNSPTYLRIRPGLEWTIQPKISFVGEIQAVKEFGSESYSGSTSTTNSRVKTSGNNSDTSILLHQGYLKYSPSEFMNFKLGRAELNYGDGLLIGNSDWNNNGRSFDTVVGRWTHPWGWADAFTAKVVDRSVTADRPGNEDLSGLYLHFDFGSLLGNFDPYFFDYQDSTNVDASGNATTSRMIQVGSYGVRLKSKLELLDYRAEFTKQTAAVSANQWDAEVGINGNMNWNPRFGLRMFSADEDFNPLFPSGHGWLGRADVLSRRNIEGQMLRLTVTPSEDFSVDSSYFWFNRRSETKSGFLYDGSSMATTSRAKEIGRELDIEVTCKLEKELSILLGYADFQTGPYITDQYLNIDPLRWYLQINAQY